MYLSFKYIVASHFEPGLRVKFSSKTIFLSLAKMAHSYCKSVDSLLFSPTTDFQTKVVKLSNGNSNRASI